MLTTVSNWHGAPIERGGVFFPARDTITVDIDPARLADVRGCSHLEIHNDPGDAVCEECERTFTTEAGLAQHRRMKHGKNEDDPDGAEGAANPHGSEASASTAAAADASAADGDEGPPPTITPDDAPDS